jgi:hypothetical protein
MPVQQDTLTSRAFVSFSVLAEEILGLSRARVYELIERGALPMPCYDLRSRRPVFNEEQQRQALAVRRTGLGIDGRPVIFYRRRRPALPQPTLVATPTRRGRQTPRRYEEIVTNLQALGVRDASEHTVATAMTACFPNGTEGVPEPEVLRVLFRHLRELGSA